MFFEKTAGVLQTDDMLIQDFTSWMLEDFPLVPEEWSVIRIREALNSKEKAQIILPTLHKHSLNEEAVKLLLEGAKKADKDMLPLYVDLLHTIKPRYAVEFEQELGAYFTKADREFFRLLENGGEEEVWEVYGGLLAALDAQPQNLRTFYHAKTAMAKLVENDWIDDYELAAVMNANLNEDFFTPAGILVVHAIGLMDRKEYIPLLAGLIMREDDLLLDTVSDTMARFQCDEVIDAVQPYLSNSECLIYGTGIIAQIKTKRAEAVLLELFRNLDAPEDQELVLEALSFLLPAQIDPAIARYLRNEEFTGIVEIDVIAYAMYTINGQTHPDLEWFKESALANRQDAAPVPVIETVKAGRNDPCPCGSGKKFKKCCGK